MKQFQPSAPVAPQFPLPLAFIFLLLAFGAGVGAGAKGWRMLEWDPLAAPQPKIGGTNERQLPEPSAVNEPVVSASKAASPEGVIEQVMKSRGRLERTYRMAAWVQDASEEQVIEALKRCGQISDEDQRSLFKAMLYERWGQLDGPTALAFLKSLSDDNYEARHMFVPLFEGWVKSDPKGAIDAITASDDVVWELDYGRGRTLVQATFTSICASDPELAMQLALSLTGRKDLDYHSSKAVQAIADWHYEHDGVDSLLAWGDTLPAAVDQKAALEAAAHSALEHKDLNGAAAILNKIGFSGVSGNMIKDYTRAAAECNLQATASWVATMPEGENRASAFSGLVWASTWNDNFDWLAGFPSGPTTDARILGELESRGDFAADASFKLASYISDPAKRSSAMTQSAITWLKQDPEAAKPALPPGFVAWWDSKTAPVSLAEAPPL